jgi:DNA-directed RNA polymerase specialized sigma24 family protein
VLVDPWSALDTYASDDAEPDSALAARDRDLVIQEALSLMPDRCRQLLVALTGDPPPSYDDLSEAFGMPIGSIGPTRARCLAKLRALMTQVEAGARVGAALRSEP